MSDIIAVLMALFINYPILLEEGSCLTRIPTVIGNKESWASVQRMYPKIIRSVGQSDSVIQVRKMLKISNSCGLVMEIRRKTAHLNRKYDEIMNLFFDAAQYHKIGKYPVTAVPVLFSEGFPPEDLLGDILLVFVDEGIPVNLTLNDLIPSAEQLNLVKEKWSEMDDASGIGLVLLHAACFSYPALSESGRLDEFQKLLEAARRIQTLDENARSQDGIVDQYLDDFWDYIINCPVIKGVELKSLTALLEHPEQYLFFNGNTVSITVELFEKLVSPMRKRAIPVNIVKQALHEAGVLITDEKNTYQVKIRFSGKGLDFSLRGYRFDIEKLEAHVRDHGLRLRSCLRGKELQKED